MPGHPYNAQNYASIIYKSLLRDITIESSLTSGCVLSQESAEDGCKGSWEKLWAPNTRELGIWYV